MQSCGALRTRSSLWFRKDCQRLQARLPFIYDDDDADDDVGVLRMTMIMIRLMLVIIRVMMLTMTMIMYGSFSSSLPSPLLRVAVLHRSP